MDPANLDMEKIAAHLAGNTMLDENAMNDQTYQQIVSFLKTDKMSTFRSLKTAEDRVKFLYKHEAHWPLLQNIRKGGGAGRGEKDVTLSRQLRDAGNTGFSSQDDDTALKCYNDALLAAPADPWDEQGEDMALAFANRSALYFRQKKFQSSLSDTRLALKCGYPKHLKYKVLQRQAKCLYELGHFKDAKHSYRDAISFMNFCKLNKDQKQNVLNDIQSSMDEIQIHDDTVEDKDCKKFVRESDTESGPNFSRNPKFPSLSKGLTVKYDSDRGRHVIATENIKCGSYLACEDPIVNYLWSENMLSHCSNCFKYVTSLVPCYTCCLVVFCSEKCRSEAWKSFHQYECKAVEAMTSAYQNIFLAYRAVAQKPLKYFLEHKKIFDVYDYHRGGGCYEYEYESDSESGDTEPESEDENHELSGAYEAQDYQNLYNLKTHSKNSSEADNLAMATSASLMLFYLKINNYFGFNASRDSERELNEAEIYIGKLLYHFLEVSMTNSQEIHHAVAWNEEKGITTASIGSSICNTLALFNHSCSPNVARTNFGSTFLFVATEDIRKGQEVTNYYEMQFDTKILKTRQKFLLDHYKFKCRCEACEHNWPMYEFMTKSVAKPGVTAKALHHIKKMYSTISKLSTVDFQEGHYGRVYSMWANYYRELGVTLEKPNKGYVMLSNRLTDALWLRWGTRSSTCMAAKFIDHRVG